MEGAVFLYLNDARFSFGRPVSEEQRRALLNVRKRHPWHYKPVKLSP